eukprot:3892973-Amphidinium_carterae.2
MGAKANASTPSDKKSLPLSKVPAFLTLPTPYQSTSKYCRVDVTETCFGAFELFWLVFKTRTVTVTCVMKLAKWVWFEQTSLGFSCTTVPQINATRNQSRLKRVGKQTSTINT